MEARSTTQMRKVPHLDQRTRPKRKVGGLKQNGLVDRQFLRAKKERKHCTATQNFAIRKERKEWRKAQKMLP